MEKEEKIRKTIKNEGNLVVFQHAGYLCVVMRPGVVKKNPFSDESAGLFHLCGYVCVPPEHPLYRKDYHKVDAPVHGGLTFSASMFRLRGQWWFGFDLAHANDVAIFPPREWEMYKDMKYAIKQTKKLAEWLKKQEKKVNKK